MRRVVSAVVGALAAVLLVTGVATAAWTSSASTSGTDRAATMPTGPTPTAPTTTTQTSTSITVTWLAVQYSGNSTNVAGYTVARYKGGSLDTVGGTCTGTLTATTCTDTVTASGAYQYAITPHTGLWTGPEGTKSETVTVNVPTFTVAVPTNGGTYAGNNGGANPQWSGTISGTVPSGQTVNVQIQEVSNGKWAANNNLNANRFTSNTAINLPAVVSGTTWSLAFSKQGFDATGSYTVTAIASGGGNASSTFSWAG